MPVSLFGARWVLTPLQPALRYSIEQNSLPLRHPGEQERSFLAMLILDLLSAVGQQRRRQVVRLPGLRLRDPCPPALGYASGC